jgi:hypothetical protein
MNRSETVAVRFPVAVWGRLASEADKRGTDVADVLVTAAERVLLALPEPRPRKRLIGGAARLTDEQRARLRLLILRRRFTLDEISADIGCHANTVSAEKRRMRAEGLTL